MNPVSLAMDGLLAVLLLAAVGVGVRLNAKLKTLKEGQGQFVRAVGDLDVAAARAEAGLAALRNATEETHDALLTRIETARGLLPRLDRAGEDAATAAARLDEGVRAAAGAERRLRDAQGAVARRRAVEVTEAEETVTLPRSAGSAPIPFPSVRRPVAGLAQALEAAERIVGAEEAPFAPPPRRDAAPSVLSATPGDGRLARFVARRQGARR